MNNKNNNTTNKDWTGNHRATHALLGSRNYAIEERQEHDYYATDPKALELIIDKLDLSDNVWECACGGGSFI